MSLFFRFFLSFWLVAALLAVSFFSLARLTGGKTIGQAQTRLQAQAEVVASIWQLGGRPHAMHWLFQQSINNQLLLLGKNGMSPFPMDRMGLNPQQIGLEIHKQNSVKINDTLKYPLKTGAQYQPSGKVQLIEKLPNITPELFLVQSIDTSKLYPLSNTSKLLIAFAIINLISFLLARTLTERIYRLRQATQKLANGDLNSRVNISGKDEVSALADDFNQMAGQLQSMLKSQRQLVSDVSHELRSPLARLRIALELAERGNTPGKMLSRIEKEADELEKLVTDLLSLARIESSQFVLEQKQISLCDLLQKIIEDANFEGKKWQKRVVLEHCDNTDIKADPILLHSAFENIIRNALCYTPEKSTVTVKLEKYTTGISITINDQGSGVPDSVLHKLFKPFARVSEARDRKTGGFGLGLAITGRVITAHGGTVRAKNLPTGGLSIVVEFRNEKIYDAVS